MIKKNNLNDWPSFDTEEVKLVEDTSYRKGKLLDRKSWQGV